MNQIRPSPFINKNNNCIALAIENVRTMAATVIAILSIVFADLISL